jgi:hypothetical protein
MYICCSLLLHVSAAYGPSLGNTWGDCTVQFVSCTYRHIVVVVVVVVVVNLLYRIFSSYFTHQPFQCSSLVSFTCVCFGAVCSYTNTIKMPQCNRMPKYNILWEA